MTEAKRLVFFYGSYINRAVLREVDLVPKRFEVARLVDYDISIRPLANVFESKGRTVWGVVASATGRGNVKRTRSLTWLGSATLAVRLGASLSIC